MGIPNIPESAKTFVVFTLCLVGIGVLACIIKAFNTKSRKANVRKRDPCDILGIITLIIPLTTLVIVITTIIGLAAAVAWTVIWLISKIIAAVIFFPPALILEGLCGSPGPKKAVTSVLRLKWDWPCSKFEEIAKARASVPRQANNNNAAAAASSTSARNTAVATAPQAIVPPADRDVELGLPVSSRNTSRSIRIAEMDITDSRPGDPDWDPDSEPLPSYHYIDIHRDGPPPEYEATASGSINQNG
ncbi:hypothetical protein PG999_010553 [Apiospora kogelbergensis]|uniref:Uncharacterized protein n=1 Tax=Apiospora kogelbergensis TaxID=1337665 RepID=A0AAW0QD90_9PEZI